MLVTVIEVSGTTAPVESVTRPVIRADWARAAEAAATKSIAKRESGMAPPFRLLSMRFRQRAHIWAIAGFLLKFVELGFQVPYNGGVFRVGVEIGHLARVVAHVVQFPFRLRIGRMRSAHIQRPAIVVDQLPTLRADAVMAGHMMIAVVVHPVAVVHGFPPVARSMSLD